MMECDSPQASNARKGEEGKEKTFSLQELGQARSSTCPAAKLGRG